MAITVVIGAPLGILVQRGISDHRELRLALDAFEQATGVRTLNDLIPSPVPDDQNAAILYIRAFEIIENSRLSTDDMAAIGDRTDLDEIAAILSRVQPAIRLATQASEMNQCCWTLAPLDGYNDHSHRALHLATILLADARVALQGGDDDRARTSIIAALRLREHLAKDCPIMVLLIALSIEFETLECLQRDMRQWSPESLDAIAEALDRPACMTMLKRAIIAETMYYATVFGGDADVRMPFAPSIRTIDRAMYRLKRDHAFYLNMMRRHYERLHEGEWDAAVDESDIDIPKWALITGQITAAVDRTAQVAAHTEIRRALFRSAVELERGRRASGRYPRQWREIGIPIDDVRIEYSTPNDGHGYRFDVHLPFSPSPLSWQVGASTSDPDDSDANP